MPQTTKLLAYDPQTSGGLLAAVPVTIAEDVVAALGNPAAIVGEISSLGTGQIRVKRAATS